GHAFDSWFQSSVAYDRLVAAGHVACPACGSAKIEKALMAPAVALGPESENRRDTARPLSTPQDPRQAALAALRHEVEATSEYVGLSFAAEARAMHEGLTPDRPIYGEAKMEDARKLLEDGVPVAPLPFMPARKTN
ncbi:MAG: DUF1178 family protein, partial [Gemmobacter sp.]|nr:DUF1178 family protein [Gemmobacter sp.]